METRKEFVVVLKLMTGVDWHIVYGDLSVIKSRVHKYIKHAKDSVEIKTLDGKTVVAI